MSTSPPPPHYLPQSATMQMLAAAQMHISRGGFSVHMAIPLGPPKPGALAAQVTFYVKCYVVLIATVP